jgi:DNA-directed RNA polymerase specialized sigma subunit
MTAKTDSIIVSRLRTYTSEEYMSLLKDPKNKKMLDDFMIEHAPLIHKHINILKSQGKIPANVQEEDLHMAGFHGLMDAVHKFDPEVASRLSNKEGENAFAKYADRRIQGKMLDHIVSVGDIPKSAQKRAKNLNLLPSSPEEAPVSPSQTPRKT